MKDKLAALYLLWTALLDRLRSPFLLLIRLYWGWGFLQAGWGKLSNLSQPTDYFQSLGIPFPHANAILASTTETLGGLCLLLGFASRIATVPLLGVMAVAYLTAEHDALVAVWSDPDKFTGATPFLFAFACLIVLLFGPGLFSLDAWIGRRNVLGIKGRVADSHS
jgi:putative oxidoreductase